MIMCRLLALVSAAPLDPSSGSGQTLSLLGGWQLGGHIDWLQEALICLLEAHGMTSVSMNKLSDG